MPSKELSDITAYPARDISSRPQGWMRMHSGLCNLILLCGIGENPAHYGDRYTSVQSQTLISVSENTDLSLAWSCSFDTPFFITT